MAGAHEREEAMYANVSRIRNLEIMSFSLYYSGESIPFRAGGGFLLTNTGEDAVLRVYNQYILENKLLTFQVISSL